eukprot:30333-Eustigmatos_ZCMA.PRE.1
MLSPCWSRIGVFPRNRLEVGEWFEGCEQFVTSSPNLRHYSCRGVDERDLCLSRAAQSRQKSI